MKILVTGGAGFIGSNTVDRFIAEGHEVVVMDNLSTGRSENLNPKAKFYLMDVRSAEVEKVFAAERPDAVSHFAAQKSVPKSVDNPIMDAEINIIGLLNLLNQCIKYQVKKFIFISTGGALYGDATRVPTPETYEPQMISPYAVSKFTCEKYLYYYNALYGLRYTVLRLANIYGPRQIAEGDCGVVPIFANNLVAGKPSTLFAYADMPKGTTRDYVYVEDVCAANVLALTRGDSDIFNIGTGQEVSTEDLYNLMQEVFGISIPLIRERERVGDVRRSTLDFSKAESLLGWSPKVDLRSGMEKTAAYYRRQQKIPV